MSITSGALVPSSLLSSRNGRVAIEMGSLPDKRRQPISLQSGCDSRKLPARRRGLRSGNSARSTVSPAELVISRWTNRVSDENDSKQSLEKLKELVDLEGGNSKDADDRDLLRFLRAKHLDTQAAAKAFASHQKWRKEFVPKGYFLESEVPGELDAKKAYWIRSDKKGRPVLISTGRDHVYNKKDFDQFKRFVVYLIDRVIREIPPDAEQFICVLDMKGIGVKNLDSKSLITALKILQNHYPLRLEKVFLINVPLIWNGIWKVVKPFLDDDTRSRIIFVDKNKIVDTLTNDIDIQYLSKEYGGTADPVLLQDARTPNWPPCS